jgi:hypothetical protein
VMPPGHALRLTTMLAPQGQSVEIRWTGRAARWSSRWWRRALAPAASCASGVLAPSGELVLKAPTPGQGR